MGPQTLVGPGAAHRLHPLSLGPSRIATLTLLRMAGPGSPPDVGGPSHFC